jgi:hypothetical protein
MQDTAALWSVGQVTAAELVGVACESTQDLAVWAHSTIGHGGLALAERLVELEADAWEYDLGVAPSARCWPPAL